MTQVTAEVNNNAKEKFRLDYDTAVTTTNSYARALVIDTRGIKQGVVHINNTGGSNDLYYQCNGYAGPNGAPSTGSASWAIIKTDIRCYNTASSSGPIQRIEFYDNTYNFIEIRVKAVSSGNQTTAEIYAKSVYD